MLQVDISIRCETFMHPEILSLQGFSGKLRDWHVFPQSAHGLVYFKPVVVAVVNFFTCKDENSNVLSVGIPNNEN
jgi:hypothetical protein